MLPYLKLPVALRTPARLTTAAALGALFLAGPLAASASAATVPPLGTASAFSVLAGSTVTNTGPTTIDRSVGVHPGSAVTGESTMTIGGTVHKADAVALQAKIDLTTAYNQAAGQPTTAIQDNELGGETKVGGVYTHPSGMGLTGVLTLDGAGDPNSVWIFQAGSTLTTAPGASVLLINQANPCNVFWQVSSSATLGTTTHFVGTIMAEASITMDTGATIQGRTLARSGAVNLHSNVFTSPNCAGDVTVPDATPSPTPSPTPTPTPTTGGTTGGNGGTGNAGGTNGGTGNGTGGSFQVKKVPTGAVDTGYAGPATASNDTPDGVFVGWVLALGFGGVALVALRRRRVM